jgi:hypothetical protein
LLAPSVFKLLPLGYSSDQSAHDCDRRAGMSSRVVEKRLEHENTPLMRLRVIG